MAVGGFELISFYFPHIINQKKALKHASLGIWIGVLFTFVFTFVSVMYFSEWQLKNVLYPVLGLFKEVELSFLDRIDVLAMTMWVFLILSTTAAYLWVAKRGLDSIRSTSKNGTSIHYCSACLRSCTISVYGRVSKASCLNVFFTLCMHCLYGQSYCV